MITNPEKAIIVTILLILSGLSGAFLQNAETLSQCEKTGKIVYGRNTVIDCKVSNINEVLSKNYWERK